MPTEYTPKWSTALGTFHITAKRASRMHRNGPEEKNFYKGHSTSFDPPLWGFTHMSMATTAAAYIWVKWLENLQRVLKPTSPHTGAETTPSTSTQSAVTSRGTSPHTGAETTPSSSTQSAVAENQFIWKQTTLHTVVSLIIKLRCQAAT